MFASACRPPAVPVAIPPSTDVAAPAWPLAIADEDERDAQPEPVAARRCAEPEKPAATPPDFALVRSHIAMLLREGVPSIAVAVAQGDAIVWQEGFGYADPRRRTKATAHTMYSLASISKPFTATAIMVLHERGQIALDHPIDEYLPPPGLRAGAGDPSAATVERVASHTAGLATHVQFYYADRKAKVPPLEETRRRYAVLVAAPGERYEYSNLGYGLLGQAIAHVSGKSYAEFMRTEVFEPLDLRHTFVGLPPARAGSTAVRYGSDRAIAQYGFDHDGASAIYSCAHDLVRFGMFHIGAQGEQTPEILSAAGRKRMRRPIAPSDGYGLGWGVGRTDGMRRFSHSGGMPGVKTLLQAFPRQGVVIVVLTNTSHFDDVHTGIARMIRAAIDMPARADDICALPEGDPLVQTFAGTIDTLAGPRPLTLAIQRTGEVIATLDGAPPATVRDVTLKDDRLHGWFLGDIAAEQANGDPTALRLDLRRHPDRLEGSISAAVPFTANTAHYTRLQPTAD